MSRWRKQRTRLLQPTPPIASGCDFGVEFVSVVQAEDALAATDLSDSGRDAILDEYEGAQLEALASGWPCSASLWS